VAKRDDSGGWTSVAKKSVAKETVGGRKTPVRTLVGGIASEETIYIGKTPEPSASARPLLVPLVTSGSIDESHLGAAGTHAARAHRQDAVAELPEDALRLSKGEAAIPTNYVSA
jgi:nicotinate phosphoribosyltransferase